MIGATHKLHIDSECIEALPDEKREKNHRNCVLANAIYLQLAGLL